MHVGQICVKHKRADESLYAKVCEVVLRNERYVYVTMQCVKQIFFVRPFNFRLNSNTLAATLSVSFQIVLQYESNTTN